MFVILVVLCVVLKSSSFIKKEVEEHRDIAPKHNARQIRAIEDRKLDLLNPYTDKQIDEIIDEIDPMLEFIVQVVNLSGPNNYPTRSVIRKRI